LECLRGRKSSKSNEMDDCDSKDPPIVAQGNDDMFFWALHSDGSVMIYHPTGEFIDIVDVEDEKCDATMTKLGLTAEIIQEIKLRWDNYLSWLDERNEAHAKAELGIYVDKGQDIQPGEMLESEWVAIRNKPRRTTLDMDCDPADYQ